MPDTAQEKTERATQKKRDDARKKGTVAKSQEVNTAIILLTGTLMLSLTASYFIGNVRFFMADTFSHATDYVITSQSIRAYSLHGVTFLVKTLGPILLAALIFGLIANVMQVGFMASVEAIKPQFKKINPINGIKQKFSARTVADTIKSLLKLCIIGVLIYSTIKSASKDFIPLMDQSIGDIFSFLGMMMLKIALRASVALLVLAAFDYAFQKWEYEKQLRMSKQEVKEEIKEYEGDPVLKSRIRSLQRETARKRMMTEVPKADVVITNPIHYAIALKYNSDDFDAPVVLAKGARKIAQKIKEIAKENDVPIVENPELARALYKMCDIGMQIPMDLYHSVAEILAYVYGLKENKN